MFGFNLLVSYKTGLKSVDSKLSKMKRRELDLCLCHYITHVKTLNNVTSRKGSKRRHVALLLTSALITGELLHDQLAAWP